MQAQIKDIILEDRQISIIFSGCSFNCPFCPDPDLVEQKQEYSRDLKEIVSFIKENSRSADFVVFKGGEPLLQRQALMHLIRASKESGLKTILETTGTKPNVLREAIDNRIKRVIFHIKSPLDDTLEKVTRSQTFFKRKEEIISDIKLSLKILLRNKNAVDIEFITDIVPGLLFRKEDLEKIAEEIMPFGSLWTLRQYSPSECVLNKIYRNISPPNFKFMENLREHLLDKFGTLRIELKLSEDDHKDQD